MAWPSFLRKAAEQGDAAAQTNLGLMYANGEGVLKDDKAAVKWYRRAAEQGYADAQFNLGVMCHTGDALPKDYVAAYAWYSLAAFDGDEIGAESRDEVAKQMTPEQIAEANKLFNELLKKIEANKKEKADKNSSIPLTTP